MLFLIMRAFVLVLFCFKFSRSKIRVALHAQVSPKQGFLVGSVLTTAGLEYALNSHPEVELARTFYPFEYFGLHETNAQGEGGWDLILIEGWFEMINAFIHEVREFSARHGRRTIVLFFCLDPDFPGLETLKALDVDGFLTNSRPVAAQLQEAAPTKLLQLAADPAMPRCNSTSEDAYRYLRDKVLFVGSALGMTTKAFLPAFLRSAAQATASLLHKEIKAEQGSTLVVMGHGWDAISEFRPYWQGRLPQEDLCCAYSQAMAILAVTMDGQRKAGMINNRIFEALLCSTDGDTLRDSDGQRLAQGCAQADSDLMRQRRDSRKLRRRPTRRVISDWFPELEDMFGEDVRYIKESDDVARHVQEIFEEDAREQGEEETGGELPSEWWLQRHTYTERIRKLLPFVEDLRQGATGWSKRHGIFRVGVVVEETMLHSTAYQWSLKPALELLEQQSLYAIDIVSLESLHHSASATLALVDYDALWAVSKFEGPVDHFLRHKLPEPQERRRGLIQRRALLLWGDNHVVPSNQDGGQEMQRAYDTVYYWTEAEREAIEGNGASHPNLQHAFGLALPDPQPSSAMTERSDPTARLTVLSRTAAEDLATGLHPVETVNSLEVLQQPQDNVSLAIVDFIRPDSNLANESLALSLATALSEIWLGNNVKVKRFGAAQLAELQALMNGARSVFIEGRALDLLTLLTLAWTSERRQQQTFTQRPEVQGLSLRLQHVLASGGESWDRIYYARQLAAGMTRALCLGRGASDIRLIYPINYMMLAEEEVPVEVEVTAFKVGREGMWCLLVQGVQEICIQREDVRLMMTIKGLASEGRVIKVQVGLKSNMYANWVKMSEEVRVFVRPGGREIAAAMPRKDTFESETRQWANCTVVRHEVRLDELPRHV